MKTVKTRRIAYVVVGALLVIGGVSSTRGVVQKYEDRALVAAIKRGDRTAVSDALTAGANPNVRNPVCPSTSLRVQVMQWLRRSRSGEMLEERLEAPALCGYPEQVNGTDVFDVAPEDPVITEMLLRHGADFEAADDYGQTALGWAVTLHRTQTVRLLLKYGANPHISMQYTHAMHIARSGGRERVLLEGRYRETLLQDALSSQQFDEGTADIARLLVLGAGANHVTGDHRVTPLMAAALAGDQQAVEALLKGGAEVNASIGGGVTTLGWLNSCTPCAGDAEIKRLLVKAGAIP